MYSVLCKEEKFCTEYTAAVYIIYMYGVYIYMDVYSMIVISYQCRGIFDLAASQTCLL